MTEGTHIFMKMGRICKYRERQIHLKATEFHFK